MEIVEDYLRGNGTGVIPIHQILTKDFRDGTRTGQVQFSDLDFNVVKQYLAAIYFDWSTEILQALNSSTHAAGEWFSFPRGKPIEEADWRAVFKPGASNGVEEHCFRFRLVNAKIATTPARPLKALRATFKPIFPDRPVAECRIDIQHSRYQPFAREGFSIKEIFTQQYLCGPQRPWTPQDLDWNKWKEVLARLKSPANRQEPIPVYWVKPIKRPTMVWSKLSWNSEQEWRRVMRELISYCKYKDRDVFHFYMGYNHPNPNQVLNAPSAPSASIGNRNQGRTTGKNGQQTAETASASGSGRSAAGPVTSGVRVANTSGGTNRNTSSGSGGNGNPSLTTTSSSVAGPSGTTGARNPASGSGRIASALAAVGISVTNSSGTDRNASSGNGLGNHIPAIGTLTSSTAGPSGARGSGSSSLGPINSTSSSSSNRRKRALSSSMVDISRNTRQKTTNEPLPAPVVEEVESDGEEEDRDDFVEK